MIEINEPTVNQNAATKTLSSRILVTTILFRNNNLSQLEENITMIEHHVRFDFLDYALQFSTSFFVLINIATLSTNNYKTKLILCLK